MRIGLYRIYMPMHMQELLKSAKEKNVENFYVAGTMLVITMNPIKSLLYWMNGIGLVSVATTKPCIDFNERMK